MCIRDRREDPERAVRELESRVDGLVLANSTLPDDEARALGRRTPVVLLARPTVPGCDSVSAENVPSARALTDHLIAHGRRRLFFVGDPDGSPDVQERYRGFLSLIHISEPTRPY